MPNQLPIADIVQKLIGPITPIGASHIDCKRFENLKAMTELIEWLLSDVERVAGFRDRPEASVKMAARYADDFLHEMKE